MTLTGSTQVIKVMGAMNVTKCKQVKKGGQPCDARPVAGSEFCFFHDPERADARRNAQQRGGQGNQAASLPTDTPDLPLNTTQDVASLLAMTINQIRRGELDPKIGNTVGYLSGILLKAQEQGELEKKIKILEDVIQKTPRREESLLDVDPFSAGFVFESRSLSSSTLYSVLNLRPWRESNTRTRLRRPVLYPLSYRGKSAFGGSYHGNV